MMPYLTGPRKFLRRIFSWSNGTQNSQTHVSETTTANGTVQNSAQKEPKEKNVNGKQREFSEKGLDIAIRNRKKRPIEDVENPIRKKGRVAQDEQLHRTHDNHHHNAGQAPIKNEKSDRELMPPPPLPSSRQVSIDNHAHNTITTTESLDAFSDTQLSISGSETDPDMERIRHQSAVVGLPPNTGTWEPDERELWLHINNRGREALLPNHWMKDFPTLPLNLFATRSGQVPLIECHKSSDFRSVKALQELIDTGQTLRDRTCGPNAQRGCEKPIEKAINKYIKWGLKDVSISDKQYIPVHVVAIRKRAQTSRDVLHELTLKMHELSCLHREESGVLTTIEREPFDEIQEAQNETRLSDDVIDEEHNLPVIYGLIITSSVLTVFTLNCHTQPPPYIARALSKNERSKRQDEDESMDEDEDEEDVDDDSEDDDDSAGLKSVAEFDFSKKTQDIWNAFGIVIVAMMIRKTLMDIYDFDQVVDELDIDESVMDSSMIDGDDGKYGRGNGNKARSKIEDDPDL